MGCPKILAVDDEPAILRIIKESLEETFNVIIAHDGQEAIAATLNEKPDLILIDYIMPGLNGLDVVKLMRRTHSISHIPIIMVTALKETVDRIEAYQAGVDDFISKPFHPDELVARIESKLERFKIINGNAANVSDIGNLKLDSENHSVEIKGKKIHLTNIELNILQILLSKMDKIVTRKQIVDALWEDPKPDERILDIHVATLRKKIKNFSHSIETVYGKGYVIRSIDK